MRTWGALEDVTQGPARGLPADYRRTRYACSWAATPIPTATTRCGACFLLGGEGWPRSTAPACSVVAITGRKSPGSVADDLVIRRAAGRSPASPWAVWHLSRDPD